MSSGNNREKTAGPSSEQRRGKILLTLFLSMLSISAFTFGGGFVIVTLMKRRFVDELGWMDEQEMLDMTAIAQSCPGPIAVNAAILVGWKMAGLAGMLTAVLGTVIPPVGILSLISLFYRQFAENRYVALTLRGMQSGVAAVILDAALSLGLKVMKGPMKVFHAAVMALAFAATFFLGVNVIWVILGAAAAGVALALFRAAEGGGRP